MGTEPPWEGFAFTYVLLLSNGQFYVGSTNDLARRLREHEGGVGGRTTSLHPGRLVYAEACRSLVEARDRERQLKTGYGRSYLNRRLRFERPAIADQSSASGAAPAALRVAMRAG